MPPLSPEFVAARKPLLGAELGAFLSALDEAPALALRVHRDGFSPVRWAEIPVPWARDAWYLREGARPGPALAHFAGAFYLQEASAMLAASVLDARPGELLLDLCAAPGGKSSQMARQMRGRGALVSNEIEPSRACALAGNLERLGIPNALVLSERPERLAAKWPGMFDAVLVDAPCSGEGMFRRDPKARAQWTPSAPQGCHRRQVAILREAAKLVRPGGRLVYSTCTFNDVENEGTVAAFLSGHADFLPEDFSLPSLGASRDGMLRLWPQRARGDGHFAARLRRAGEAAPRQAPIPEALPPELSEFVRALPEADIAFRRLGGALHAVPSLAPDIAGLRAISSGARLLRYEKNRAEPEHALAMALAPGMARFEAPLTEAEAEAFRRGEALPSAGEPGWALATWEGLPLGWGKRAGGVLKNHIPKGLRRGR